MMAATRAYGRRGDGAGGTCATETRVDHGPCSLSGRRAGEFFRRSWDPCANLFCMAGYPQSRRCSCSSRWIARRNADHHGSDRGERKRRRQMTTTRPIAFTRT
jgi:hypothetical protein